MRVVMVMLGTQELWRGERAAIYQLFRDTRQDQAVKGCQEKRRLG